VRPLNAPFAELGRKLRVHAPPQPKAVAPPVAAPARPPADDPTLFARAMDGVVPVRRSTGRVVAPVPTPSARRPVSEEAEALAVLADLVSGEADFDITDTREYIEGAVVGLDPRVVRRLRRGDFARQAHIDLHGLVTEEARAAVDRFLADAVRAGHRCLLIVHGRGLNSKDHTPVLKERLKTWLSRGRAAHLVLAFATARPHDGGAGALYVLLRRDRRRRPMRVTEGTKV
jgi:DNA-nicking Smr family endonuclease